MINKEIQFVGIQMIPLDQPVVLHVGGQTTGSEDHVVYLAANRAGLRRSGYGLFCFDPIGTGADSLGDDMPAPADDAGQIATRAERLAKRFAPDRRAGSQGFLVSAPDLAGPLPELLLGRFHPNVRMRARALRLALGQPVQRLVLAVQPYETLFHSVWMTLALDRRIEPFADYAQALAAFQGGWADLAAVLAEELEVRDLVVQATPASATQMLTLLLPGVTLRQPVQPLPKPRVTQSAVAMSQRCIAQGTRLQPGQRDRLVAFHARQPQNSPDLGFSALALADLRGRYVADLDMIAEMAGAHIVGAILPALAAE